MVSVMIKIIVILAISVVVILDIMNCGCNKQIEQKVEFTPSDKPIDPDLLCKLKQKYCCEFDKFMCRVYMGEIQDYSFLLHELSLIELIEDYNVNYTSTKQIISFFLNMNSGIKNGASCIDLSHIEIPEVGGSFELTKQSCGLYTSSYKNDFENVAN